MPQLTPLKTIAFFSYLKECWKSSGAINHLIEYHYAMALFTNGDAASNKADLTLYYSSIKNTLQQIMTNEDLTFNLKTELGNCFLHMNSILMNFCSVIRSALEKPTKENIERAINSIVITPDGFIDKKKSIIEIALRIESALCTKFTAYHCVSVDEVLEVLRQRKSLDEPLNSLESNLRKSFIEPYLYWEPRHRMAGTNIEFFECVALYGGVEAIKYHTLKIEPSQKQAQLSKAALRMIKERFDIAKFLFFFKEMKHDAWLALLQRNFLVIFAKVFSSKRYRHLCVNIYEYIQDTIDLHTSKTIFDFLSKQNMLSFRDSIWGPISKELLQNDLDPIFLALWRMVSQIHKNNFGQLIFRILDRFLPYKKFYLIIHIIQDSTFTSLQRYDLAHYVIMNILLMHGKMELVDQFIDKFDKSICDVETIRDNIKSLKNFKLFAIGDGFMNVDKYDELLAMIDVRTNAAKKAIALDKEYIKGAIQLIRKRSVTVEGIEKLLKWCFSEIRSGMKIYLENFLIPENLLTEMFKNHLLSRKQSIFVIRAFDLSLNQVQHICKEIAKDTKALYQFCYDVIRAKDFARLPKMLACVFENDAQRVMFIRSFFRSPQGTEAIRLLLVDAEFDDDIFSSCNYKNKLSLYVAFQKHFVLSLGISIDLHKMVRAYSPPACPTNYFNSAKICELLPHESVENFKQACRANSTLFTSLLNNSLLIQLISNEEQE